MKNRRILLIILILLLNVFSANAVIDVICQDDFELQTAGDTIDLCDNPSGSGSPSWDETIFNPDSATILDAQIDTTTLGSNSTKKFKLNMNNDGYPMFIGISFNPSSDRFVVVEYDVYISGNPKNFPAGQIIYSDGNDPIDGTGTSKIAVHVEFNDFNRIPNGNNGRIHYTSDLGNDISLNFPVGSATETNTGIAWAQNTWYRVRVVADQVNKTFDLRVTNIGTGAVSSVAGQPFNDSSAGYIRKMWFGNCDKSCTIYVDNIYIYQDIVSPPANGPTITFKEYSKGPVKANTGLDVDFADSNDLASIQYKIGIDGTWKNLKDTSDVDINLSGPGHTSYTNLVYISNADFTAMAEGENRIYFRAIDSDVSPGPYTTDSAGYLSFYKDTQKPNVGTITYPNSPIIPAFTQVTGTASDAVSGIPAGGVKFTLQRLDTSQYWTGAAWGASTNLNTTMTPASTTNNTTISWVNSSALPAGGNLPLSKDLKVTVVVTNDVAANGSITLDSYIFQVVPGNPTITINNSSIGPVNSNTGMDVDFGDETDLLSIKYKVGSSGTWTNLTQDGSATFVLSGGADTTVTALVYLSTADFVSLSEGDNLIYFQAVDNLDNTTDTSTYVTYKKDSIVPSTLTLNAPITDPFSSMPVISGTVGDNATGMGFNVNSLFFRIYDVSTDQYWTGTNWGASTNLSTTHSATTNNSTVNWTKNCTLPLSSQLTSEHSYTFYLSITDRGGNTATSSSTFKFRDVPDIASVTTPANGSYLNSALTTIQGSVADRSGGSGLNANSTTFTIQRDSDDLYWTGAAWGALTNLTTTHIATTGSTAVTWTDNVAVPALIDGETYYFQAKATNINGGVLNGPVTTVIYDTSVPTITSASCTMSNDNTYLTITFSEKVWSDATRTTALMIPTTDFTKVFNQNVGSGGVVTASVVAGFYADSGLTTVLSATTGYSTVYAKLTNTGGPASGVETISLTAVASQVYDRAGNAMSNAQTTGNILFKDLRYGYVTAVNTAKANGYYKSGEVIDITVTYNAAVTVTGNPRLKLNSGASAYATYNGGTGTATLTFRYIVGTNENSPDLDYTSVNDLELNGGTITNGGNPTNNTLPTVGTFAGAHAIVIDNTAPTVISVNSSKLDGHYTSGEVIDFVVTFSENTYVTVTDVIPNGTPRIALNSGGYAYYVSGGGSSTLTFRYTVGISDSAADLDYTTVNALELNGGTIKDKAGNISVNTLPAVGTFAADHNIAIGALDTTPPSISTLETVDTNGDGYIDRLVVTFDEPVKDSTIVSGSFSASAGSVSTVVGDGTSDDAVIWVNLADGVLTSGETPTLTVAAGGIKDPAGNANTLISNFASIDKAAPVVSSYSPVVGGTNVDTTTDLVLTFSENVSKGTGNILIKEYTGDATVQTIDVTSVAVSISGSVVTINPASDLSDDTQYYVFVDSGALKDSSAAANSFGGISGKDTWKFTTGDRTAPTVTAYSPTDNSTDVNENANLVLTFSENVNAGTGNIVIYKSDATVFETIASTDGKVTGSGTSTITINPAGTLDSSTDYYVQIDSGAFKDTAGNDYAGITDATSWNFKIKDYIAPTILSAETIDSNSDGFIDVVKIIFSEKVKDSTITVSNFDIENVDGESFVSTTFGDVADDGIIYITFTDGVLHTGEVPKLNYAEGALSDFSNNLMETANDIATIDRAAPVIWGAETADGDSDGYIDAVKLIFSENLNDASIDVVDFSINMGAGLGFNPTTNGDMANDNTIYLSINDGDLSGDKTPTLSYTKGKLCDLNDNIMENRPAIVSIDKVIPRIIATSPQDDSINNLIGTDLTITFSENINVASGKNILIYKADGSLFDTIPFDDARVTGGGSTEIEIDIIKNFDYDSAYYVLIDDGALSDAAGNDFTGISDTTTWSFSVESAEKPVIVRSMSAVGSNKIYVQFDLKVNKLDGSDIAASDLEYKDYDLTLSDNEINGIEKLSDTEYYLTVKNSLTADNILFDKISAKVNSIYGSKNHPMDETLSYALSDYGINILNVALYDTTHPDDSTSLKNFDGSETISNKLIKVRAVITSSIVNSASDTALLYYDVFDGLSAYAQFWRPDENLNSRQVVGRNIGGNTWEFSIPEDSSTIGKFISFVLKIKDLYSYRSVMKVAETDFNPRQISTRNVKVKEIKLQEGKVTILNNVINPNNGEVTKLTYTLDKAGPTSIVVYDLAGDVIKVLYGGFQDAGDFVVTWDGRNENNRIVARGVYFVRVRAPGIINQIRKVLVIK